MNDHKIIVMKPSLETSDHHAEKVAHLLNTLLADEYVLYTKTRNAHWHIERQCFYELHRLFERQVVALDVIIDDVAEQAFSFRYAADISMRNFLEITRLSESEHDFSDSDQIIRRLLADHEILIRILIKDILTLVDTYQDPGTSNFMTAVMVKHEAFARISRAYGFPDVSS